MAANGYKLSLWKLKLPPDHFGFYMTVNQQRMEIIRAINPRLSKKKKWFATVKWEQKRVCQKCRSSPGVYFSSSKTCDLSQWKINTQCTKKL